LTVPVLRNIESKNLLQLQSEIAELAARGREGKLRQEHFGGGTFTISSLGRDGGLFATPILNHPEVAIIGINRIYEKPVAQNGQVVLRQMTYLSATFDHRVIDGHYGAGFITALKKYLANPNLLFLTL